MNEFKCLRKANNYRQAEWPGEEKLGVLFRALEFGGEAGELLNAVKKLYRLKNNVMGSGSHTEEEYVLAIKKEVGDVQITLDLLCRELNINIWDAAVDKFNETSKRYGLETHFDSFGELIKPRGIPATPEQVAKAKKILTEGE